MKASVIAAAAALAATIAAAPHAAPPVDRTALLERYEPVLYFHRDEEWAPEAPEVFVSRARLERRVSSRAWSPVVQPLPTSTAGCAYTPCYRLDLPCPLNGGVGCYRAARSTADDWAHPRIYGRVLDVPPGSPPPAGVAVSPRYLVRYWLFYDLDDWRSAHDRLWQVHEGDWESITIGLSPLGLPLFAAYSEHCSGTIRPWSAVSTRGATHPVVYVALGSHANLFANRATSIAFSQCLRSYMSRPELAKAARVVALAQDRLVDRTGTAHPSGPAEVPGVTPLELTELTKPLPDWARFPGRWSEGQLLWVGRKPSRLTSLSEGAGPATPSWTGTRVPSFWHSASS